MQLLAKFKKILYMQFRATLNFRKFKVAVDPMYEFFFKLWQKLHLILLMCTDFSAFSLYSQLNIAFSDNCTNG